MENFGGNNENYQNFNQAPMTVGDWMVTLLLCAIPFVNIIMLLVWAFSSNTNLNKKNYAKAGLIFMLIGIVLSILFMGCMMSAISQLR